MGPCERIHRSTVAGGYDPHVIVAVTSLKGGTGKTTLSVALAEAAADELGEALLVDADPQSSATGWSEASLTSVSPLRAVAVSIPSRDLRRRLAGIGAEKYPLTVIDTPPGDQAIIAAAIDAAALVVVPVRPSVADIDRLWATLDTVTSANRPALVVLSQVRAGTRALQAARTVLENAGVAVAKETVASREAIGADFGRRPGPVLRQVGADLLREILGGSHAEGR